MVNVRMNRRILIPSDFSGNTINLIQVVLEEHKETPVDIILCFGYNLNLSTSDLLFISRSQIIKNLVPESFMEAIRVMAGEYCNGMNNVIIEPFFGTNHASFRAFLEGSRVEGIYIYKDYQSRVDHNSSFDITPMAIKMDIVHLVPFVGYTSKVECEGSFAEVCLSKVFG